MPSSQPTPSRRAMLSTAARTIAAASAAGVIVNAAFAEPASNLTSLVPEWQQKSDRKVRLGVVGGNFGASFPWHRHPNCVVHAVSDLIPDRRAHLTKTFA